MHSRISRAQSGDADRFPGWWLIPTDVTDDHCKQIVGEEWDEAAGKYNQVGENHYLDCEAMQYVMALRAKLHRRKRGALTLGDLKRLRDGKPEASEPAETIEPASPATEPEPSPPPEPAKKARFKVKRRRR